jgi:hypothetical protein
MHQLVTTQCTAKRVIPVEIRATGFEIEVAFNFIQTTI